MSKLSTELLQIINQSHRHMTAEEVFLLCKERGIKISLASVYRILGKLTEEGSIRKISVVGQTEMFDKSISDHAHLICTCCGDIKDVFIDEFKEELEKITGVPVDSYDLNIRYRCEKCRR